MKHTNPPLHRRAAGRRIAGHAQEDHILDPYHREQKLGDGTICPQCGVVYQSGRWQWQTKPEDSQEAVCPACRRINDKFPAGIVELRGAVGAQKAEIVRLARHQEQAEKEEHPLNRIINIEEGSEAIVIETTDIHLPRRIGEAVKRAFHGRLNEDFEEGGYFVRVNWVAET